MDTVKLKNGDEVPAGLAAGTMYSLKRLLVEHPVALHELVMASRDRGHVLFGNASSVLGELNLIQETEADGTAVVHGAIRSIVLSAVTGEGFDMSIDSPEEVAS